MIGVFPLAKFCKYGGGMVLSLLVTFPPLEAIYLKPVHGDHFRLVWLGFKCPWGPRNIFGVPPGPRKIERVPEGPRIRQNRATSGKIGQNPTKSAPIRNRMISQKIRKESDKIRQNPHTQVSALGVRILSPPSRYAPPPLSF